jgi:hypothetical protein
MANEIKYPEGPTPIGAFGPTVALPPNVALTNVDNNWPAHQTFPNGITLGGAQPRIVGDVGISGAVTGLAVNVQGTDFAIDSATYQEFTLAIANPGGLGTKHFFCDDAFNQGPVDAPYIAKITAPAAAPVASPHLSNVVGFVGGGGIELATPSLFIVDCIRTQVSALSGQNNQKFMSHIQLATGVPAGFMTAMSFGRTSNVNGVTMRRLAFQILNGGVPIDLTAIAGGFTLFVHFRGFLQLQ